jgi:hypothetical protein
VRAALTSSVPAVLTASPSPQASGTTT